MCKLDHLEKICSPQTIVNLAKKYYQIYAECLTQLLFLEKQRFSAPIVGFANKFISKYRAVTDFIDHFLVKPGLNYKTSPSTERTKTMSSLMTSLFILQKISSMNLLSRLLQTKQRKHKRGAL